MASTTTWLGRVGAALIVACAVAGCQRSNCTAPADVSGVWHGPITSNGVGSSVELTLVQSGTNVAATYVDRDRIHELRGLRIGRRVEFESDPVAARCPARLHGTAEFCGEVLGLTLDGDDCFGALRARGTLQRANTTPFTAGGGGSSGRVGTTAPGTTTPVPSAGRGDMVQPTPPCPYTSNGRCDEPEGSGLCPDGTDFVDCTRSFRPCAYQNDGACDEPEGSGLCDEGQDAADCETTVVCGGVLCNVPDGTPGIPGLAATRACCVAGVRCGLTYNSGACFEITSGAPDASCTNALQPYWIANSVMGCCRPDGLCGVISPSNVLGCVLPESLGVPFTTAARIACGRDDFDAGGP